MTPLWKRNSKTPQSVDTLAEPERVILNDMWVSCSKNAVEALSLSTNKVIKLKSFSITTMPISDVHKLMDLGIKTTVLWELMEGKIGGAIVMYSSLDDILKLADILLKKEIGYYKDLSDENISVIHEIMNIVAGYYTDKLVKMFNLKVKEPCLSVNPSKAVEFFGFGNIYKERIDVLLFKATFIIPENMTEGNIILLFRTKALKEMIFTLSRWKERGL